MTTPTSEAEKYAIEAVETHEYTPRWVQQAYLAGYAAHAERVRGLVEAVREMMRDHWDDDRPSDGILFHFEQKLYDALAAYDREGK